MKTDRRTFLRTMSLGATGAIFLSPWDYIVANPKAPDRYFIFCYFAGGWDHLMSLDPRDPNKFTESNIGTTKIQLAWDQLPQKFADGTPINKTLIQPAGSNIQYGPAMEPMAKHYDKSCMLRGISMDTVTHAVGMRYFITGMPPAGLNAVGSSIPTRIVAEQGDLYAIPNLVVNVESYNQGLPSFASGLKVASVTDLISTLQDGSSAPNATLRTLLEEYRNQHVNCDPLRYDEQGLLALIKSTQKKSRTLVSGNLDDYFNFSNTSDPEIADIKKRYGITSLNSVEAQAATAFQALKNQVAQCATIQLANTLDTHADEWASDHPEELYKGFKALSVLVDDLASTNHPVHSGSLLDHTTIVCFSEFARTALLNSRGGRDHSVVNSCLLMGAGVPHNTVIGATSDDGMNPHMIDPVTGKVTDAGGLLMTPRNIYASLMKGAGHDYSLFRTDALPCLSNSK